MERTDTRRQRRDATSAAILRAARELVVERGQDDVSLREVARRAGYSPAAMYRYFASKDELLAALGRAALEVLGGFLEAVPRDLPPARRLVALAEEYGRFAEANPDQLSLVFNRMRIPPTSWRAYVTVAWPFTLIVETTAEGMATGDFRQGDAPAAAFGLWSLAHGAATLRGAHLRDVRGDYREMERAAYETYVSGLMAEGSGR